MMSIDEFYSPWIETSCVWAMPLLEPPGLASVTGTKCEDIVWRSNVVVRSKISPGVSKDFAITILRTFDIVLRTFIEFIHAAILLYGHPAPP